MITVRRGADRGHFNFGWLDTYHTFSFGSYVDRRHMGFRALRVVNEDVVAPAAGFPQHPHAEMEIITYVVQGAVAHRDTSGGAGVIRRGDVQHMSAGTGIEHSEFNASETEPVHLLQIWLRPGRPAVQPGYAQRNFPDAEKRGRLRLLVSPDGADGSLTVNQDARLYASLLPGGATVAQALAPGRHAWVQVISGTLDVRAAAADQDAGTATLGPGDAAAISEATALRLAATADSEFLLFDLN